MLCTPWPQNLLTSSRLSASAASDLGDNFSLGTLKNDLVAYKLLFLKIINKYVHIIYIKSTENMINRDRHFEEKFSVYRAQYSVNTIVNLCKLKNKI
jgi:hypothetical protein